MNKIFLLFLNIFLVTAVVFILLTFFLLAKEIIIEKNQTVSLINLSKEERLERPEIALFFVGDIMLDRGVEYKIKNEGDFKFPFLKIADELSRAEILFGNLESPISEKGEKVGSIYSFRADPETVNGLKFAGFNILSLANNHILDYQKIAMEDTMEILKENDIDYVGAGFNEEEAFSVKIKEIRGTKIGFLAYTNFGSESWRATNENSGIAFIEGSDLERIKKDIGETKKKVDVLIVSLHSGDEYSSYPNSLQTSFAKTSIEAGADLVIGHHPHIIQPVEKYKDGWIAYSLGNFVFDQSFSEMTREGLLLEVKIENKKISKVTPFKIKISESFQPYFAKEYYLEDFVQNKKDEFIFSKKDFLEVNFPEMKIKVYRQGILGKEVSILNRGDPEFWAGTPSGLYQVISKQKLAFSSTANVYMPWNINFYGKYNIHGQPYYPNGQPFDLGYTGGCIQLLNDDAKNVHDLIEKGTPVLVINKKMEKNYREKLKNIELIPGVSARAYLVADLDSGFVFTEKSSQTKLPIASLTKLMTAIAVAENIDLRDSILIRPKMLEPYGSTQGLIVGERFRAAELFYPLLIESSNDAAEALSYFLGRERTIELMNEKAKMIGMDNTDFVDSHGFNPKNISTANDLFYLAEYLLNVRPPLLKITKGEEVESFGEVSFKDLKNKNTFFDDQNFLGGKSGYNLQSGYTGIFLFNLAFGNNDTRKIVIIILGSEHLEDLEKDTKQILEWLHPVK